MTCGTKAGIVFDVGNLYAHFQGLQDTGNPKGAVSARAGAFADCTGEDAWRRSSR